jgi:hypothetical protein
MELKQIDVIGAEPLQRRLDGGDQMNRRRSALR